MLKLVALITMILDHVGLFWNIEFLRVIGRISFPIYCFLIVKGVEKSKDLKKYSIRILVLAILSQYVWKYIGINELNVLFTYFLFIQFVYFIKIKNNLMITIIFLISILISIRLDYGMYGFLLLFIFYYIKDIKMQFLIMLGLNIYFVNYNLLNSMQMYSLISLILISKYNKPKYYKMFRKCNNIFYLLYPIHLIVLFEIYKFFII